MSARVVARKLGAAQAARVDGGHPAATVLFAREGIADLCCHSSSTASESLLPPHTHPVARDVSNRCAPPRARARRPRAHRSPVQAARTLHHGHRGPVDDDDLHDDLRPGACARARRDRPRGRRSARARRRRRRARRAKKTAAPRARAERPRGGDSGRPAQVLLSFGGGALAAYIYDEDRKNDK